MKRKIPHLCSPITVGRVTFRNCMFSAPMGGTDITNDDCIGPKSTAVYELQAIAFKHEMYELANTYKKLAENAGCECAIHLGMEGKEVHIVEMRDELAPDANIRHRPLLLKEIAKYVTVHIG